MPGVSIALSIGNSYAISSSSGGYAIPVTPRGAVTITAKGGVFSTPVQKTITMTGKNIKVDFVLNKKIENRWDEQNLTTMAVPPKN